MLTEVRVALRRFRARPGATVVLALIIAVGIGAGAAVFSVARASFFDAVRAPLAGVAGSSGAAVATGLPPDPITLAGVTVGLSIVALAGCWMPVRAALRMAPAEALRNEQRA